MKRFVCDMGSDHLPNKDVEQQNVVAVPHNPRKEGRKDIGSKKT